MLSSSKKQLHDKIFNELAPARLLIELAFGSSNKQSFSGARPLNYNIIKDMAENMA